MPPKSKKGQKMDLGAFLADTNTGGSWADEMDTLPTGPSALGGGEPGLGGSHLTRNMQQRDGGFGSSGGPGGRPGFGGDDGRPQRAEVPIPTEPPYTAFVGNLTFEVVEADLENFFQGLGVKSVRVVSGQDGRPRGFAYVEFSTVEDLKNALTLTGEDLAGRVVRISVAEASTARMGRADEASTWERTGPLPSLGGRQSSFGGPRGAGGFGDRAGGGGGFEEVEREGPIRGGKFTPSTPSSGFGGGGFERRGPPGGGDRGDRGPGFSGFERAPPVEIEREGPIRGGKFTPSAPTPERRSGGFGGEGREPSRADGEATWSRGGALPPRADDGRRGFGSGFGGASEAPAARRPLQLSARSTSTSGGAPSSSPSSPAASSRSNPFGNAKPIDTATKDQEAEAKLLKQREEQAEKVRLAKEEREKIQAAEKSKEASSTSEEQKKKSDGDWVRRGPLPQRGEKGTATGQSKPKQVAPPLSPSAVTPTSPPNKSTKKETGSFSFANLATNDEGDVEEVTKGVEETKI